MASRRRSAMVACGHAHRDRIAAEQALVQQLDIGAFDEAQFDQPAFQFGRRQAGAGARATDERLDAAAKAHARVA